MATLRGNPVAWNDFYKTARWRQLRKLQLMQHPLCKFCLERGIVTAANVVDHVAPHKGDWTDFITGDLQSLCEPRHNSAKRQIELRGYRCDVGIDGYPTDPNHPVQSCGLIRLDTQNCCLVTSRLTPNAARNSNANLPHASNDCSDRAHAATNGWRRIRCRR